MLLIFSWIFIGWPGIWENPAIPLATKTAEAATFSMQTGYYVGTGASLSITGIGFQPQLVIIKADTTAGGGAVWKSSSMAANTTAYFPATANNTSTLITLDSDGFTVSSSTTVNAINVIWKWIAFAGSDCSSSGTFCVGSYTGSGGGTKSITTGFQPDLVWVKGSGATAATWRSSSMADNVGQYFTATTQDTTGALYTTLDADGFTVGATNNAAVTYQYVAFKKVADAMNVSSYTGNGTSQSISSMGFTPDWVFVKNANAATAVAPVFNLTETYGNYSSLFTDAASATTHITSLDSDGFSVGASSNANGSGNTLFWASFGGATDASGSGTFNMDNGSYTGNGTSQTISGLAFRPDLIIIKQASDVTTQQQSVFKTKLIPTDYTAYLASGTTNFTGGITINSDGFSLGTSTTVNDTGDTYYWTAFGNAFDPHDSSGAADFAIGAYAGNVIDSRNITRIPFQPDLVAVKRYGGTAGAWRSSAQAGDLSGFFAATAETSNVVQSLNSDGFQIGTAANVNTAASVYFWFSFKSGSNFTVNTYSGTGSAHDIDTVGFQPDFVWVKRTAATNGVMKPSSLAGDSTQYFNALANVSDRITGFISNGFSVGGNQTETNTSGTNNYRYAAWIIPTTTLGDGTDPGPSTVAPGSTNNYVDQFTLVTNIGTDSVTALTVTTANTTAIASMQIWNEAMTTQYFSTVSSPVGNAWNFNGGTPISVSNSSASFRVIFTAQSHASLAAGTYAVTGTVTSYTCANRKTGTDTDSATITVDNSPPSDATWGTITPGNQQIELNWSNPGDSDFSKVLILRKANSIVTDAPTDGTEYSVPGTIGDSTIIYVNNGTSFTDTGLTNGTNYYYKIFAYDTYINYASGSGTGPHTPQVTNLSISVSPLTWGVGIVDAATVQMSTSGNKIGVTNDGNVSETFTLQISDEDDRDEWTHSSLKTSAGNNIYVLSGIFCATSDSPTSGSFNGDDSEDVIIFPTSQTATDAKFAYAGGTANAVAVPVSGERSLWLRLDMPTVVSGTYAYGQHTITVRISCQQP